MRRTFILSLFALVISLGLSQISYAVCTNGGTTVDGGNILNCPGPVQLVPLNGASTPPDNTTGDGDEVNIPPGGGVVLLGIGSVAIDTMGGPDEVVVSGEIINDIEDGLETGGGGDIVTVNPGAVISGFIGFQTQGGADTITVNGGTITGTTTRAIGTGGGSDLVVINGGTFNGPESIRTAAGADTLNIFGGTFNGPIFTVGSADNVLIQGGTFNGNDINLGAASDFINIAADIDDLGDIDCGGGANNTIRFSLNVPDADLPALNAALAAATATDDITINGNTYSWIGCENIENNLNGVVANLTLGPVSAVNPIGTEHTVTANLTTNISGLNDGVEVIFSVSGGPNQGADSGSEGTCSPNPDCTTDANGEVSWTYTSNGLIGLDTIVSTIDDTVRGTATSNTVEKEWIVIRNVPTLSEWGLIAMATLLGIAAFMVIRRRQLTA